MFNASIKSSHKSCNYCQIPAHKAQMGITTGKLIWYYFVDIRCFDERFNVLSAGIKQNFHHTILRMPTSEMASFCLGYNSTNNVSKSCGNKQKNMQFCNVFWSGVFIALTNSPELRRWTSIDMTLITYTAHQLASSLYDPLHCQSKGELYQHDRNSHWVTFYRNTKNALLCPLLGALSDDAVWRLSVWRVAYIRSAGGVCGRPAGWRVLADRARLGRPGSRLPLRASVTGLGGGISWRPPAYSLLTIVTVTWRM